MQTQKIVEKIPKADVVSAISNAPVNGGAKAQERAEQLLGKNKKSKPKQKAKPEQKEPKSIASILQNRIARLEKREKVLNDAISQRTKYLAKLQGNLEIFKTALVKVKAQRAKELTTIKELTEAFSKDSKV